MTNLPEENMYQEELDYELKSINKERKKKGLKPKNHLNATEAKRVYKRVFR